jgi:diguanylate cyclase (GGDEF)-like protein
MVLPVGLRASCSSRYAAISLRESMKIADTPKTGVSRLSLRARLICLFLIVIAVPAVLVSVFVFNQPGVVGLTVGLLALALAFGIAAARAVMRQVEPRLEELAHQRRRLRESIRRTGQTLASNLDRPALLELALKTAVDAVHASGGRLVVSASPDAAEETGTIGSLAGLERPIEDAERSALKDGSVGESRAGSTFVASVALRPLERGARLYGLITVGRNGRPFTDEERELLRLLAAQTTLALENVDLHYQVRRQAVTDELTGLGNYARFQELLSLELEQVKRYGDPVALLMLDLDDFKSINDTFGHQQGDAVLTAVARALRETCRDADTPVRYGGDELAVILPRTPLEGALSIGERARVAIEILRIGQLDGDDPLRVTASVGVSASATGDKVALISDADRALYIAKREGKNRIAKGHFEPASVPGE